MIFASNNPTISGCLEELYTQISLQSDPCSGTLITPIASTGQTLLGNIIATSGSLALTGQMIYNYATVISGLTAVASGSFDMRMASTGATIQSQISAITGNIITTGAQLVTSIAALSGNLATTGAALSTVKVSGSNIINVADFSGIGSVSVIYSGGKILVSGVVGAGGGVPSVNAITSAVTIAGTGNITVSTSSSNIFISGDSSISGALTQTGAQIGLISGALSSLITITGQTLYSNVIAVSGSLASSGSSLYNMLTIGSGLDNSSLVTLSGNLTQTGLQIGLISGELATKITATGATLYQRDLDISGALQTLIAAGGSVVKVSGSVAIPIADFTGIGGTVILYSGGKIFISGATVGVGAGIPSVNGITSAVTIAGTGGFSITSAGSNIYVSGLTTVGGGQVVYSETGTLSGDANFTWDSVADTLEIGQPRLNYPDNPLSLGGSGVYLQSNIRNRSNKNDASTDLVITTDAGSDASGYLDIGMNGSNYSQSAYDMNGSGDGYIYVNGGSLALAVSTTGDVIQFFTSGTRAANLRMTVNDTGVNLPYSGVFQVGELNQTVKIDNRSVSINSGTMFFSGVANNPIAGMYASGWGISLYAPALYSRRIKTILPSTTTSQIVFGDAAPTSLGTVSTLNTETLGEITQFTPAAGLSAGTSMATASLYRGTGPGVGNGFFFVTKFLLNSDFGSGLAIGTYGAPSGSRIFAGVTSQALATQVGLNDPVGNFVGLQYLWASGGSVGTGQYMQNWAITSRNNVSTSTGTTAMVFQTGLYRFGLFCPPHPNNNIIYYQLDDLLRGSGIKGQVTSTLPVGSTAMRGMVAVGFVSGLKTIGTSVLYQESPNSMGIG